MSEEPGQMPPDLQRLLSLDDADHGPAAPLSHAERDALVEGVMNAWDGPAQPRPATATERRGRRRKRMRLLLVAAIVLAAGSAAAYFVVERTRWPAPDPATADATSPQTQPQPQPEEVSPARPANEAATEPSPSPSQARDLLAQANRQRAEEHYRQAAELYLQAARQAPSAPLAQVAQVAAADLKLERLGEPARARALYLRAIAAGGPLTLEARIGAARAARSLGDHEGEREALRALREAHPGSPDARWASERLEALDGR